MIGTSLNQYQVTARIGAGGMGDVYRGHDSRLGRDVAVKVLPNEFARDGGRLKRFEQEAKTLASLNHPNILSIFDTGVHGGTPYLVSELLEGQTLRDALNSNPNAALALRKGIEYGLQIAQGLAAAHAKGIIHRDLKPENIFITKDGRVKILDFGLAKLQHAATGREASQVGSGPSPEAPTFVQTTEPGTLLGTVGYMSPEQVRGEDADHRSDIFGFGCILYEMISGQRAFRKDTAVQSMNAILTEQPRELLEINSSISPALDRIVSRCLEKNPEERFQSAKDLAFALEALTGASSSRLEAIKPLPESGIPRRSAGNSWKWAFGAASVLCLALAGLLAIRPRPSSSKTRTESTAPAPTPGPARAAMGPATWLEIGAPHDHFTVHPAAAISPDGRQIAFWAPDQAGKVSLWVRSLDSPIPRVLAGTESTDSWTLGFAPFWSPDGRSLGFFAERKLKRIDLPNGSPLVLADAANPRGASWGADNVIVFVPVTGGAVCRVSASGGQVSSLPLNADQKAAGLRWPHFLPDGRHFLVNDRVDGVFVASFDSKGAHKVSTIDSRVEYGDGHLFFGRKGNLFAQEFDLREMKVLGDPVRLAENLGLSAGDISNYAFSVATNGTIVYSSSQAHPITQLTWFNRAGEELGTVGDPGPTITFALSSDGQHIVANRYDATMSGFNIWLIDPANGATTKFVSGSGQVAVSAGTLVWFPTSDKVLFRKFPGLAMQSLRSAEPVAIYSENGFPQDISPDGKYALILRGDPVTGNDLWLLSLTGNKGAEPYLVTKQNEAQGCFSPDGRWIAYTSDDNGRPEVYVQSFPEKSRPVLVSVRAGGHAKWRKDGKEMYYLLPDNTLMAVPVDSTGAVFQTFRPQRLFKVHIATRGVLGQYCPSDDGQKFLVNGLIEEASGPKSLTVLLNWQSQK